MTWTHQPPYVALPVSDLERRVMEFDAIVLTYRVLDGIERDFEHCHTSRRGWPVADQLEPKARELIAADKRVLVLDGK